MARFAPDTGSYEQMQCLEIWGGNRGADTGVTLPGIDAWVCSRPHGGQAGGDLHYVAMCGHGYLSRYVVADVAGHGEAVAELASTLRELLWENIETLDPTGLARALNNALARLAAAEEFATAIVTTYYAPEDHLIVCNAGHPRPLWYSAVADTWQVLTTDLDAATEGLPNLPLGIVEKSDYSQFALPLAPDDLVVLYTDSLTEARVGPGDRMLREEGLLEIARDLAPAEPETWVGRLVRAVAAAQGDDGFDDDVTVMLLHHNARDPEPPADET